MCAIFGTFAAIISLCSGCNSSEHQKKEDKAHEKEDLAALEDFKKNIELIFKDYDFGVTNLMTF